jgi:hypothetical protein
MSIAADELRRAAALLANQPEFGPDPFAENLERLLAALDEGGALTASGLEITRAELTGYLRNRLDVQRWLREVPEIESQTVENPIFFMGLPRSGTTFLLNLFDHDPRLRLIRVWEGREPTPPPALDPTSVARRIEAARLFVGQWQGDVEGFDALHLLDADGPDECTMLLAIVFAQAGFPNYLNVPGWFDWMVESLDFEAAYRLHKQQLQILQWQAPARRWALKFPNHVLAIPAIRRVYPDASFVFTHRDPDTALASLCSLTHEFRSARSERNDRGAIGEEMSAFVAKHIERILEYRAPGAMGESAVVDVDYYRMVADPVGVSEEVYRGLGMSMSPEVEERLARWTQANPKGKRGAHRYAAADFALDSRRTEDVFSAYRARFGVRREASV